MRCRIARHTTIPACPTPPLPRPPDVPALLVVAGAGARARGRQRCGTLLCHSVGARAGRQPNAHDVSEAAWGAAAAAAAAARMEHRIWEAGEGSGGGAQPGKRCRRQDVRAPVLLPLPLLLRERRKETKRAEGASRG